jgi:hypothetical protein
MSLLLVIQFNDIFTSDWTPLMSELLLLDRISAQLVLAENDVGVIAIQIGQDGKFSSPLYNVLYCLLLVL